jgi:hypothetical protein
MIAINTKEDKAMKAIKKFSYIAAITVAAAPFAAWAATTNIDATANFIAAVTLGNEVDMDFGDIVYSTAPVGGDTVTLATDGTLSLTGSSFSPGATGTPGSVDVTAGNDGETVNIQCDATATMGNGAGASIDIVNIEVATEGNEGPANAGFACAGIGVTATSMVLDLTGGTANSFKLGGTIDGATASSFAPGSYSTVNGDDIQIDVVYQ